MILRYLVLFGGIVMMITGCNSLISQQFGTHRLRTLSEPVVSLTDVGDADYVALTKLRTYDLPLSTTEPDAFGNIAVLKPLLTAEQAKRHRAGAAVSTNLVGWYKSKLPDCHQQPSCLPPTGERVIGLVNTPKEQEIPTSLWDNQRISLRQPVIYLQLGEAPLAWYWNLLLFAAGIALALVPEGFRHRKARLG